MLSNSLLNTAIWVRRHGFGSALLLKVIELDVLFTKSFTIKKPLRKLTTFLCRFVNHEGNAKSSREFRNKRTPAMATAISHS
jgi:hypothetical protein